VRSRILNLQDRNNPLLSYGVVRGQISPLELAQMTSEDMASPERRLENQRLRRNSLSQTVGINDRKPANTVEESIREDFGQ
jgi:Transcription factor S-II (TFIIS), central domain